MKIILFGASGMVGRGVLRECLLDPAVTEVKVVGRSKLDPGFHLPSSKLTELVMPDLFDYQQVEAQLRGYDACFICLGIAAKDMLNEKQYERITLDLTLSAAKVLLKLNPNLALTYVSGAGTDSSQKSKSLWMRVKGQTENALFALPLKHVAMFRPLAVQPMNGEQARNGLYRVAYTLGLPLVSLLRKLMPTRIVSTEQMGRAMLAVAKGQTDLRIFESADIAKY
jgi:uncharacterized protein YbjT (DUF2867 family)